MHIFKLPSKFQDGAKIGRQLGSTKQILLVHLIQSRLRDDVTHDRERFKLITDRRKTTEKIQ